MEANIKELQLQLDWYRDQVVWGFYEEETPQFYQGKEGEHEICEPVTAKMVNTLCEENARMRKALEELERACTEWAEVSQRNYQCAKLYFEALQLIAAPTYGIQSIMEDYEIDSVPYLEAAHSYYYKLVTSYQATARSAIAGVEEANKW